MKKSDLIHDLDDIRKDLEEWQLLSVRTKFLVLIGKLNGVNRQRVDGLFSLSNKNMMRGIDAFIIDLEKGEEIPFLMT